jgi:hypothetical protein
MRVSGQRHAPAALPPGRTRYPLYRTLGGPQGRSGQVQKISPPPGFDTDIAVPILNLGPRQRVGGHRHAPGALLTGKNFGTCYRVGWVGPGVGLEGYEEEKISCCHRVRTPIRSARIESLYRALPASFKTKINLSYKLVKDSARTAQ